MNDRRPITRHALTVLFSASLLGLLVVAPASAQTPAVGNPSPATEVTEPGHWNATVFVGPGFGGGLQSSALELGAAAGYNFTDRIAAEGEFGFARQSNSGLFNVSSNSETFAVNGIYHFLSTTAAGRFVPYGTFGIDVLHGSATASGTTGNSVLPSLTISNGSTNVGINVGAGLKTALSDRTRFRADIRYFNGGSLPSFWRIYGGLMYVFGM